MREKRICAAAGLKNAAVVFFLREDKDDGGYEKEEKEGDIAIGGVGEVIDGGCYQAAAARKNHGEADTCSVGFDVLFFDFGVVV